MNKSRVLLINGSKKIYFVLIRVIRQNSRHSYLHIKSEVHHIAVLHYIFFAFNVHFSSFFYCCL